MENQLLDVIVLGALAQCLMQPIGALLRCGMWMAAIGPMLRNKSVFGECHLILAAEINIVRNKICDEGRHVELMQRDAYIGVV